MGRPAFEEIEHTADLALRVHGADLTELLLNSARGMLSLAQVLPAQGPCRHSDLSLQAPDSAALLVLWLEEVLYLLEMRQETLIDARLRLTDPQSLQASVELAPVASIGRAIKAVTFHDLQVESTAAGYQATIVFDV